MHHPVKKGSSEHKAERSRYLNHLVQEFLDTKLEKNEVPKTKMSPNRVIQIQEEVLANLANFAYDPYNHDIFLQLGIHHRIFLAVLEENAGFKDDQTDKRLEFAIGGLSNCVAHLGIGTDLISRGTIEQILSLYDSSIRVKHTSITTLTFSISLLFYLSEPEAVQKLHSLSSQLLTFVQMCQYHEDKRVTNLAINLANHLRKLGIQI